MRKESEIKSEIIKALNKLPDTFVFTVHTTGIPIGVTGKFRKNFSAGTSDLIGLKGGRFFAMEVKVEGNGATELQMDFLKKVSFTNGYAYIVHSVEEALDSWKEIKGFR